MKKFIIPVLFCFYLNVKAQENEINSCLSTAIGSSFLGSGDMVAVTVHGQYDKYHNPKRSTSISFGLGNSNFGVSENAFYYQFNLNTFWKLFKNTGLNTFRVGTGFSFYGKNETILISQLGGTGIVLESEYGFENTNAFGVNIVMEKIWEVTETSILGLSIYQQPYLNGELITGISLRYGFVR